MRQEIEHARLRRGSKQLQLTISAAVAAVDAETTSVQLLDCLRASIREAKAHGRNRTYLWQPSGASAVEPPKLTVQAKSLAL